MEGVGRRARGAGDREHGAEIGERADRQTVSGQAGTVGSER